MKTEEKWSTAAIRIFSNVLTPRQISDQLDLVPSESYQKGDPVSPRNPNSPKRKDNLWLLDSGLDSAQSLEDHIIRLVEVIEQREDSFKGLVSKCVFDVMCGFSSENGQGGFTLDSELLRRIVSLPISIDLVVNLYPPEGAVGM